MNKPVFLLVLTFILGTVRPAAADRWSHFLPAEDVRRIQYDRNNKAHWFGTDNNGLWRFDGRQFEHYFTETPDGRIIKKINALAIDPKQNQLWVGTDSGLFSYHLISKQWEYFDERSGLSRNKIITLFVDRNGILWYGSQSEDGDTGGGIGKKDSTGWFRYTTGGYARWNPNDRVWVNIPNVEAIPASAVDCFDCIAQDREGNMLFGSRGAGLCILDKTTTFWKRCFFRFSSIGQVYILSVAVDRQGKIWMGTRDGVCRLNPANDSLECYTPPPNSKLVHKIVNAIWIEAYPDGELKWFGTNGGVSVLDSTNQVWETFTNETSGLGSNAIRDIIGDDDGNLWFASLQGRGASRLNRSWTTLKTPQGLSSNFTFAVAKDKFGGLWVGADQGGVEVLSRGVWQGFLQNESCNLSRTYVTAFLPDSGGMWVASTCGIFKFSLPPRISELPQYRIRKNIPSGFPENDVRAITIRNNVLWAGTYSAGLVRILLTASGPRLDKIFRSELPGQKVTALAYDSQDRLWVGTDKGLVIYDGVRWLPTALEPLPPNTAVSGLASDLSGAMWVGTDLGLLRFDHGQWQHFTTANGLPDDRITAIKVALDGEVWCGTVNGAAVYINGLWNAFTTSSTDGGLSDNFISALAFGPAGVVWFATYGGGISRYDKNEASPQTFLLESFKIVTETGVIFHYSGYDTKTPSVNLRYQYALDNSPTWLNAPLNNLTLSIIEEGLHTFSIRAIDEDGNVDRDPPEVRFYKISSRLGKPITIIEPTLAPNLDSLWLYIPPATLAEGSLVSLKSVAVAVDKNDQNKVAAPDSHLHVTGIAFRLVPEISNTSLLDKRPMTLTIFYNKTVAQKFAARRLAVYSYDGKWEYHGGTVDAGRSAITTTITQLDTFALLANLNDVSDEKKGTALNDLAAQPRMLSPQFAERMTISFKLGESGEVTAKIYNLAGRLVQRLCENLTMNPGHNALEWNGRDRDGKPCPSGMYLICVQAHGRTATKTVMVVNR